MQIVSERDNLHECKIKKKKKKKKRNKKKHTLFFSREKLVYKFSLFVFKEV